ncbi:MAG: iron-containing alcohol dehydrogenase family protein [Fervidobacterium sp.]
MSFYMPTKVIYQKDGLLKNRDMLRTLGERFLVITGKSSKRNGSLDDVLDVLDGKYVYIYDETPENPPLEILKPIANKYDDADVVIGLGGGSPMDTAKALAVLIENKNLEPIELYNKEKYSRAKPIVCIPTTAGTGSEVTQYSVLTVEGKKRGFSHDCIFPTLSFVDYKYTMTLGKDLTISTALDALSHAIEGFLSLKSTPFSDIMAIEAIKLIKEFLPRLLDDPENEFFRERIIFASTLAGMVIAQTGTTIAHALGYPLTTDKGIKHGLATAVFLPFEIREAKYETKSNVREKALQVLKIFDGSLEEFYNILGLNLNITFSDEEINNWAFATSKAPHISSTPGTYNSETLMNAYREILEKYCNK